MSDKTLSCEPWTSTPFMEKLRVAPFDLLTFCHRSMKHFHHKRLWAKIEMFLMTQFANLSCYFTALLSSSFQDVHVKNHSRTY